MPGLGASPQLSARLTGRRAASLHRADNLAAYLEEGMTNLTRSLVLSLMIVSVCTVGAFIINGFLAIFEQSSGLPVVTLFASPASLISNVVTSNFISNQKASQMLESLRSFLVIQYVIFVILVFIAVRLAYTRLNPKSVFSAFLFSLFVIPGIAIKFMSFSLILYSRLPEFDWSLFASSKSVPIVLQAILSIPFYTLLFYAGAAILTDGEPVKTQNRAPVTG